MSLIIPELKFVSKRLVEINFTGTVPANSQLTLLAGPISYPFRIRNIKMVFNNEANNWVRVYWLLSSSRNVSTTGLPSGSNIFGRENPTNYFIGKALVKQLNVNIIVDEKRQCIKNHINNTGPYAYVINNSMTIQEV